MTAYALILYMVTGGMLGAGTFVDLKTCDQAGKLMLDDAINNSSIGVKSRDYRYNFNYTCVRVSIEVPD